MIDVFVRVTVQTDDPDVAYATVHDYFAHGEEMDAAAEQIYDWEVTHPEEEDDDCVRVQPSFQ